MTLKKNFTLIELIVSIVVIGILAAIVMLNISDLRLQAEETAYAVNSKEVQTAVDRYKLEYGEYPTTPQPSKDSPQLVELDKIIPEFIRKEPKGDFVVEVDEKGKTTIKKGEGSSEKGEIGSVLIPHTPLACEEAEAQGYICIYTPEQFNNIRNDMGAKYILMNDINLEQYHNWNPIGTSDNPFKGVLNGNGNEIKNLVLGENPIAYSMKGLFGVVTYGKISNLSIVNAQSDRTNDTTSYYTSFLIASVDSTEENNPDSLPLTLSNISLSGTAINSYGFAPLVTDIMANNPIQISNIHTDVHISGVNSGAGLISYYEPLSNADDFTSSISVQNIEVNGLIEGGRDASGVIYEVWFEESNETALFENIVMNATISSDAFSSGFAFYLNSVYGDQNLIVRNVRINGDITATGDNEESFPTANGFVGYYEVSESNASLIENIEIKNKITSPLETIGFIYYITYGVNLSDHIIRNIDINSDLTGLDVEAFTYLLDVSESAGTISVQDVDIMATINKEQFFAVMRDIYVSESYNVFIERFNVNLIVNQMPDTNGITSVDKERVKKDFETSNFIGFIYADNNYGNTQISQIDISAKTISEGEVSGFLSEVVHNRDDEINTGRVIIENINAKGFITSQNSDVFSFVNRIKHEETMLQGSVDIKNIDINYTMVANSGTAYTSNTPTDLRSHFFSFYEVNDHTNNLYKDIHQSVVSGNSIIENISSTLDLTNHKSSVSQTR